jgi:hypothetical protein
MNNITNLLTASFFSGFIYFVIWLVARMHRHRKYRNLREIHSAERIRRASLHSRVKVTRSRVQLGNSAETLRIAEWEAKYGVLADDLDLVKREETYWTTGSAIQGASAVGTAVLVAFLVWGSGRYSSEVTDPIKSVSAQMTLESAIVSYFQIALPFFVIAGIFGAILLSVSKRVAGKIGGLILMLGGISAAGKITFDVKELSLFKIDKPKVSVSIRDNKELNGNNATDQDIRTYADAVYIVIPAFPDASHLPTAPILCVLKTTSSILTTYSSSIYEVAVITSADRRELLPAPKRIYASNWGLARQRAETLQSELVRSGIPQSLISLNSVGPKETSTDVKEAQLSLDRESKLRIIVRTAEVRDEIKKSIPKILTCEK